MILVWRSFYGKIKEKNRWFLINWKNDENHYSLIIRGARQIGKTETIEYFAKNNYQNIVEINFAVQKEYSDIFENGFEVDQIIKNIFLKNSKFRFVPNKTLIFFDELQALLNCATSLKPFKIDGRYDVICSGSMMGINYKEIDSYSVGYKTDYNMYSLDFEEFLWAKGYKKSNRRFI